MAEFFEKYHIEAEVLTPIFIGGGAGVDISKKDYYFDRNENKIYVLNMSKFIDFIIKNDMFKNAYEEFMISKDTFYKFLEMNKNFLKIDDIKSKFCKYVIDVNEVKINEIISKDISGFIKDSEMQPYIPGSSIKGALRTIILKHYLNCKKGELNDLQYNYYENKLFNEKERLWEREFSKERERERKFKIKEEKEKLNKLNSSIESKYLKYEIEYDKDKKIIDKLKDISISDSDVIDNNHLILCRKIDILPQKKDGNVVNEAVRECLKKQTKIRFGITIKNKEFDIKNLLTWVSENAKNYQEKYLHRYDSTAIYNDCFIPIGGGVGFTSKTYLAEIDDNYENGLKKVGAYMQNIFNKNHIKDYEQFHFAPRMRKVTKYDGELYDMGLLAIKRVTNTKTGAEIPIPKVFN